MFAVEAGSEATILCPVQVGRLSACYYGRWLKDTRLIISIPVPGRDCTPQAPVSSEERYTVDRETFSLKIANAHPEDSGNYTCELLALNPTSGLGQSLYRGLVNQSLSVSGEFHIIMSNQVCILRRCS